MTDKHIIIEIDIGKCEFCEDSEYCYIYSGTADFKWMCRENERLKSELQAKELELIMAKADLCRGCQYKNDYKAKEQECKRLKWYLKEIRDEELKTNDIEWDEYETHCIDTEYTNIINLVEEALEERNPEDCRYGK